MTTKRRVEQPMAHAASTYFSPLRIRRCNSSRFASKRYGQNSVLSPYLRSDHFIVPGQVQSVGVLQRGVSRPMPGRRRCGGSDAPNPLPRGNTATHESGSFACSANTPRNEVRPADLGQLVIVAVLLALWLGVRASGRPRGTLWGIDPKHFGSKLALGAELPGPNAALGAGLRDRPSTHPALI